MVETLVTEDGDPVTSPEDLVRVQYTNHLGTAVLECDQNGNVISYEEMHPYGTSAYRSALSASEVSARRYRYTGKERDEETGLDYFGARYFAPWLGRWTSADPLGLQAGLNLYLYGRASPVRFVDPNGMKSVERSPGGEGPRQAPISNTAPLPSSAPPEAETPRIEVPTIYVSGDDGGAEGADPGTEPDEAGGEFATPVEDDRAEPQLMSDLDRFLLWALPSDEKLETAQWGALIIAGIALTIAGGAYVAGAAGVGGAAGGGGALGSGGGLLQGSGIPWAVIRGGASTGTFWLGQNGPKIVDTVQQLGGGPSALPVPVPSMGGGGKLAQAADEAGAAGKGVLGKLLQAFSTGPGSGPRTTPGGLGHTIHSLKRAAERGFSDQIIDDIVRLHKKGRTSEIDELGQKVWRYTDSRGNSVLTDEFGEKIVSVFSSAPGGTYIPRSPKPR